MTILTWAMSDNAPIDPELPDAVKAWNDRYVSPKMIVTSTKQFFDDFETSYKNVIPSYRGDYTEYWTDGVSSGAKETALSRTTSDRIKQAEALWAIKGKPAFPVDKFNDVWKNLLLYNEHTWGAFNSVSAPEDPKVISQWNMKKGYVLHAKGLTDTLTSQVLSSAAVKINAVDVYNTLSWPRTDVVYVSAALSKAGDMVKDASGKTVPSQRLSTGELVFVAADVPAFGKKTYEVAAGKGSGKGLSKFVSGSLTNGIYTVDVDNKSGDITKITKTANGRSLTVVDTIGFNKYTYMPGDSLAKIQSSGAASISIKENGPVVSSLLVKSAAPGTNGLTREIRLINGIDRVEIINTIDKKAIRRKESVHFSFPFKVPGAQVRYSIPWGSITAESDQLPNANHNWYTMQRWVDVSNANFGVTWSSPDAPLFEIGKITTGGLLGSLRLSPLWTSYTPQSSQIYSWVMNNLWHTNFKADQDGVATFHYYLQAHDSGYDSFKANQIGLNNHQPLIAGAASTDADKLFFKVDGFNIYVESIKPADDGNGVIVQLVNAGADNSRVNMSPQGVSALKLWESNLTEDKKTQLNSNFVLPGKGIMTLRVEQ
ncbi:glycoside hydrolase family 38 C-terminal domain-containing protein [Mucilaginibacter antarcticus]